MIEAKAVRVLIVEDEFLVAMELEDSLTKMGYEVAASAARMDVALKCAKVMNIDFAILDINVGGTKSFPVADILRKRRIPFVFASGYGSNGLEEGYVDEAILRKPYALQDLKQVIATLLVSTSR